jgi:glycosyltransferase involved in cell wall biosynthesis
MPADFSALPAPDLVSIVIPCYNAREFLAETLESAFHQTYPRTEIIVVDDGSTDGTTELIRSYGSRVIAEFGPNRGASAARNRGTALARGSFIQYLDADDLLTSHAIEQRVAILEAEGADVAYSDWEKLVEIEPGAFALNEQVVRRIEDVHPILEIALITAFWAPPAALTYRRTLVDRIGGWKEWLPIIQDARFLQDAGLVGGKFAYAPGIGARYRVHRGASLSRRSTSAFALDVFRNACDLQATFEARGGMPAEKCLALAQVYDYAARSLFFHDRAAFRDCVGRLEGLAPGFPWTWPRVADRASTVIGFRAAGMLLPLLTRMRRMMRRTQCGF